MAVPRYRRILLKLSGETLGKRGKGLNDNLLQQVVNEIRALRNLGVELAIVIGGGNFWRKRHGTVEISADTSDYLGMIGTTMNALALRDALRAEHVPVDLQSYIIKVPGVDQINTRRARMSLTKGRVVIFGGGTGKPHVTTDTAAAQRARDIKAQVIFKASQVDGVYSDDPRQNGHAHKFSELTFNQAIRRKLGVMDMGAYKICQQANIPVILFKWSKGALVRVAKGDFKGTMITP